jgi:hypothetical protein
MSRAFAAILARIDGWFTAAEPRAAGRMGWFRIVYALIYLWHLSLFELATMSGMPSWSRTALVLLAPLPADLSPAWSQGLEQVLVAALVLLLIGWRVRWMTAVVLVAGVLREAWPSSVAVENSNVFLVFYIPLFMGIAGGWDATYSLHSLLGRRRGGPATDPGDDAWTWFVGARAALVVLAALFVSSSLFKSFGVGTWLEQHDLLANLMLQRSVKAASQGLLVNPLAPWIASQPFVYNAMQMGVLAFEGLFFAVLFGRTWRHLFIAIALIFHSINAIWLLVSFTPVMVVYAMFVDWEALWRRVRPRGGLALPEIPARAAVAGAWALALVAALTWHAGLSAAFHLGGWLDWQRPWFAILPLALAWAVFEVTRLARASLRPALGQHS